MKCEIADERGMRLLRVMSGRDAWATSPGCISPPQKNLLTSNGAARYKRISSSMEDKDADDEDPDH
jgi:hypothetical protein